LKHGLDTHFEAIFFDYSMNIIAVTRC